ncbi:MAG: hypothetical protein IBX67_04705 [Dehalococcoidia bacterium]|nr:hypothetical protein [Dehalococcoidia bacterium]
MTDWEKDLPPIARERLARIGELTQEERQKIADSERLNSLLSEFHQGRTDPEGLWKRLKGEGKPSLLREAQMRLLDSLTFGSTSADLHRNREGLIAIETLKEEQHTPVIESSLRRMEDIRQRYRAEIDRVYAGIRDEVERNPQLRLKQVQQGQGAVMVQLTVEETIEQLPQWRDFLSKHEERYSQEFAAVLGRLRDELA